MKTYFKYEGVISSKEAVEAIAAPVGIGPFCGFGSATISNGSLTVNSKPNGNSDFDKTIKDRLANRDINLKPDSGTSVNFGCISKDGYVHIDDAEQFNVTINGSKGSMEEVFLFAVHTLIEEPVENPVSFVAYWNEGNYSFYDLYKRSLDVYYPLSEDSRVVDIASKPYYNSDFSYDDLLSKVEAACPNYKNNNRAWVLIGIYGNGTNSLTKSQESFAIVPYEGRFPQVMHYNTAIHSSIIESITRMETLLAGLPKDEEGKLISVKDYVDAQIKALSEQTNKDISYAILPVGSIILWEGEDIPDGWEEYTKASGRVVIGYQAGGISVNNAQIFEGVGDTYNPIGNQYSITISAENLPKHRHAIGLVMGKQDNSKDADNPRPVNFDDRDSSLRGGIGYGGSIPNVQSGSLNTSYNLADFSIYPRETSNETLLIDKLLPSITLKYIRKK